MAPRPQRPRDDFVDVVRDLMGRVRNLELGATGRRGGGAAGGGASHAYFWPPAPAGFAGNNYTHNFTAASTGVNNMTNEARIPWAPGKATKTAPANSAPITLEKDWSSNYGFSDTVSGDAFTVDVAGVWAFDFKVTAQPSSGLPAAGDASAAYLDRVSAAIGFAGDDQVREIFSLDPWSSFANGTLSCVRALNAGDWVQPTLSFYGPQTWKVYGVGRGGPSQNWYWNSWTGSAFTATFLGAGEPSAPVAWA